MSLNLYTYCANNPLIYCDPTGHSYIGKDDYEAMMWYLAEKGSGKSSYQLRDVNNDPLVKVVNWVTDREKDVEPQNFAQSFGKMYKERLIYSKVDLVNQFKEKPIQTYFSLAIGMSQSGGSSMPIIPDWKDQGTKLWSGMIFGEKDKGVYLGEYYGVLTSDVTETSAMYGLGSLFSKVKLPKFKNQIRFNWFKPKSSTKNSVVPKHYYFNELEGWSINKPKPIINNNGIDQFAKLKGAVAGDNIGFSKPVVGNNIKRVPVPGDVDFIGPIPGDSWRLTSRGQGAHMLEKVNVKGRTNLSQFDTKDTPRYYPNGTPESAGQAHMRLHHATKEAGIELQGGNPNMTDIELIEAYTDAYSNPNLEGILGDLRTPNSKVVVGNNLSPLQAFLELLKWGKKDK